MVEVDDKAAVRLEDQLDALDDGSYVDVFKFFDLPIPNSTHPFKLRLLKERMRALMERIDLKKKGLPMSEKDEERLSKANSAYRMLADETLRKVYTDRIASHWRPNKAFENTEQAKTKVKKLEANNQLALIKEKQVSLMERGGLDKDGRAKGYARNFAYDFNIFENHDDSGASDIEWEGRDPHESVGKLLDCIGPMLQHPSLSLGVRDGVADWLHKDLNGLRKLFRKARGPAHCIALHGVTLKLPPATQMRVGELAKVLSEAAQMLKTATTFAKFNEAHILKIARGLELASETYPDLYSNRRLGLLYQFSQVLEGTVPIDNRIQLVSLEKKKDMNGMFGFVMDYDIEKCIYTIRVEKPEGVSWVPKKIKCATKNVSKEPTVAKKLRVWSKIWEAHLGRPYTEVTNSDSLVLKLLQADAKQDTMENREKSTNECAKELVKEALELLGVGEKENEAKRRKCDENTNPSNVECTADCPPVSPSTAGSLRMVDTFSQIMNASPGSPSVA